MKDVVLDKANRYSAVKPTNTIDVGHAAALSNVASRNEKGIAIRLSKRITQKGYRNVRQSHSVLPLDAVCADATSLGVTEDQADGDADHFRQKLVSGIAEGSVGIERETQTKVVAQKLCHTSLANHSEVLRVAEEMAKRREQNATEDVLLIHADQFLVDVEIGRVAGADDGRLHFSANSYLSSVSQSLTRNLVGDGKPSATEHAREEQTNRRRHRHGLRQDNIFLPTTNRLLYPTSAGTPEPARRLLPRGYDE